MSNPKENSRTEQAEWMRVKAQAWEQATLPPKLFELRQKLGQKAKQEPKYRFYTLSGESVTGRRWEWLGTGCEPMGERPV